MLWAALTLHFPAGRHLFPEMEKQQHREYRDTAPKKLLWPAGWLSTVLAGEQAAAEAEQPGLCTSAMAGS